MRPRFFSSMDRPVALLTIRPRVSFSSTRFPAAVKWATEMSGRSTSATWNGMRQLWPSVVVNATICCPKFAILVPFAARYLPPARDMRLGTTACGNAPGGATDSSAPESITAVTVRHP